MPSLYEHVGSLADLRCSIALRCVEELTRELMTAAVGRSGSDALAALASAYRHDTLQHPARYLATQAVTRTPPARAAGTDGRSRTRRGPWSRSWRRSSWGAPRTGPAGRRAGRAARHGFVSLEVCGGFALPEDVDDSFTFLVRSLHAGVQTTGAPGAGARVS